MKLNGSGLNGGSLNGGSPFASSTGGTLNAGGLNAATLNGLNGPPSVAGAAPPLTQPVPALVEYQGLTFGTGTVSVTLEQRIVGPFGKPIVTLQQIVQGEGSISLTIQQDIVLPNGAPVVPIQQVIFGTGTVSVGLEQRVVDPADFVLGQGDSMLWKTTVTLKGVDVSASLTGSVRVESEENSARIAEFILNPAMGTIELTDWVGAPVTIDFVRLDPVTLLPTSQVRLFTGVVDVPDYDTRNRLTTYKCTDSLQQKLDQTTRDDIDTLIGGRFSPFVFDEDADNFTYSQDQLSTVPKALDLSATGFFNVTDWDAKTAPDFLYGEGAVIGVETGGGVAVELESFRKILTEVRLEFDYSFERLRERQLRFQWKFPGSFCDFLNSQLTIPRKEMITAAAEGGSWVLDFIRFEDLPPSQIVRDCPAFANLSVWINEENGFGALFTLFARGVLLKRFSQSVKEVYPIVVQAPLAEFAGPISKTVTRTVRSEYDTDAWDEAEQRPEATTSRVGSTDDFFEDRDQEAAGSRPDMENALETEVAKAKVDILRAHRNNEVTFTAPMNPLVDITDTIEIDTTEVKARGKVKQAVYTMNILDGTALVEITLAISRRAAGVSSDTPIVAPPKPDTISGMSTAVNFVALGSRWGGLAGDTGEFEAANVKSLPDDPDVEFNGYTGNKVPPDGGAIIYTSRFSIETTAIDQQDRDELVAEADTGVSFDVDIPNDLLILAA